MLYVMQEQFSCFIIAFLNRMSNNEGDIMSKEIVGENRKAPFDLLEKLFPTKIEIDGKTFPAIMDLSSVWGKQIHLTPPLIDNVLRQGHKMMLSGTSKAGKTFALMQLAVAVATGRPWFGFSCRKGKPLYINLELDEMSCIARFKKIGAALKLKTEDVENIIIWNLRGYAVAFEKIAPKIAELVKTYALDLVIIDPIYKVFSGSENDQETVAVFCNSMDLIAQAGASVVYCHHHSKGIQGNKDPMDRASGSGVFARDADALLDMIEIFLPGKAPINPAKPAVSAWQLSGVLREFPPFQPKKVYFDYPLHEVCTDGALDSAKPLTLQSAGAQARKTQVDLITEQKTKEFEQAYSKLSSKGKVVKIKDMSASLGVCDKTVKNYAKKLDYICKGAFIVKKEETT